VTRVAALLFDLDGTLLDSGAGNRAAIEATCRDLVRWDTRLDAGRLLDANAAEWAAYWPEVEQQWVLGALDGASVRLEAWRRTLRACGCDDPQVAAAASDAHGGHLRATLALYPEVPALLSSLSGRFALGLVTNGASDTQRASLSSLGLEQTFASIAISAEHGVAKPDPALFEAVLHELAVEPERAWHVGDGPDTDVAGAHAAGLTAVWLTRGGSTWKDGDPPPEHTIGSLAELGALLG
jgi:putative hydrolase of the HAD superfamily